jgi:hypothetical protein
MTTPLGQKPKFAMTIEGRVFWSMPWRGKRFGLIIYNEGLWFLGTFEGPSP